MSLKPGPVCGESSSVCTGTVTWCGWEARRRYRRSQGDVLLQEGAVAIRLQTRSRAMGGPRALLGRHLDTFLGVVAVAGVMVSHQKPARRTLCLQPGCAGRLRGEAVTMGAPRLRSAPSCRNKPTRHLSKAELVHLGQIQHPPIVDIRSHCKIPVTTRLTLHGSDIGSPEPRWSSPGVGTGARETPSPRAASASTHLPADGPRRCLRAPTGSEGGSPAEAGLS